MTSRHPRHPSATPQSVLTRRKLLLATATLAAASALEPPAGMGASVADAQPVSIPNMPAKNPFLADSVFPITHFNPAVTDAVAHAGPTSGRALGDADVMTVATLYTSSGTVNVSSIDVTDAFTATPSMGLPVALAAGASMDVAVKFVATDGRVHNGTLTVHSDDSTAPTRTMNLAGFRQAVPQNTNFPAVSNEPDFPEVVNGLYGYSTVVGTKQQLIDAGEQRIAVGDEVLSAYWVKADASQPVSMRLMSAWHSGWDCGDPTAVSYGSFAFWFPKGRTSTNDDRYILGGAKEDIQRVLPRQFENPANPAAATFDPGSTVFGFHIELEFSDESLLGPLDIEPGCQPVSACGHRMRFWPVKDSSGALVQNAWIVTVDMHRPATPGRPQDFFANYDYNDETYLIRNMMPAPH